MKKFVAIGLLLLIAAVTGLGQKSAGVKVDPSKPVGEAFHRLIDGIKQVDVDKVMAAYEKSDRLLIFNNNGTATIGWDNVRANIEAIYAKVSNVSMDITGMRIEMMGKTNAYVSCKWHQSQEFNGKLEDSSGRMTLIYKLVGKDWKITHRHTSPDKPDVTRPVFPSERQD